MATTPAAVEAPPRAPIWEDFVDIFFDPRAVFERRRDGRFVLALLVLSVAVAVLFFAAQKALAPVFDAEFARMSARLMAKNPQLTAEQVGRMREMGETFGVIGFAVVFPVAVLVGGLILWGIGKLFGAAVSVGAAVMVATYSKFPVLVQQLAGVAQGYVLSPEALDGHNRVSLGPARFYDPDVVSPMLIALAGRLDLFTLWSTLLVGLALHVVGKLPKREAFLAAGVFWVLGAFWPILGALRQG